jgi:hypothetical protein
MSVHGSRTDGIATFDGLNTHSLLGTGARRLMPNHLAISEMTIATSAMGAEDETGGGNPASTPDLMAEFGLIYHCDWTMDDQPFPLKVKNGARFIHVPYSFQTHDGRQNGFNRDAAYLGQVIKDQFDVLYAEGGKSGTVLCISLHPYYIGKPHCAKYLDDAIAYVLSHESVLNTTADDIADY